MTRDSDPADEAARGQARLLQALQRLLAIEATDVRGALQQAAQPVADALGAEKIDALLPDPSGDTLVAVGVSDTPLGRRQRALGLDRLPMAGGGRFVEVYRSGTPFGTGHAEQDPVELPGVVRDLGVRSTLAVPFAVGDGRRGVLAAASPRPDAFAPNDLPFLEAVAHWVGLVAHRAELAERAAAAAAARARRAAVEEERIALLARERVARDDAEAALRLRNDFLSVAAHDLRSPLTTIIGRAQLVESRLRHGKAIDDGWLEAQMNSITDTSHRMLALVNEFNDVARLQTGQALELQVERVDLVPLVRAAAEEAPASAATGAARVLVDAPDAPVEVEGDGARLGRVFQNVIGNAVKYSPEGTPVYVTLRADGDWATIGVRDEGVGIPAGELPRIFTRFYRASTARGIAGNGIGLAGAKAIVEQHDGQIALESAAGAGTTVTVRLPLASYPEAGS